MKTLISVEEIKQQFIKQLSSLFLINDKEVSLINPSMNSVLSRSEYNFSRNSNKYYSKGGQPFFNPYHSAQYTIFLYYFSNTIFKAGDVVLADKIYYLNKTMNACDLFYEVELPAFFKLDHPVGAVIGRGKYNDGFSFSQNCTVGNNKGIYPIIGQNVRMCANSSIIGKCIIGDNVIIGANSGVKDENIPSNSLVFGHYPQLIIKTRKK